MAKARPWVVIALLGAAAPGARAQLIRDKPAEKAPSSMTVSEALADLVKRHTRDHQEVAADQVDDDGVPGTMVAFAKSRWPNPKMAERELDRIRPRAKEFAAAWQKYEERKAITDVAVAEAAELEKAGKLADAAQRLSAALTIPDRDASGNLPQRGPGLEPVDAEYQVLEALIRVTGKAKDFATAVDAVALMQIRQKPLAQVDERVLWIFAKLSQSRFDWEPYNSLSRYLRDSTSRGHDAHEHYLALGQYGLHPISLSEDKVVKPGDWVQFRMNAQAISDDAASSKNHYEGIVDYDCKDTGKLASYDRTTGQFHYYESCKQKKVVEDQSLDVKLKSPPPAWARAGRDVPVIGRVKKAGPHWQIVDAFVSDRWLGKAAPVPGKL